MWPRALRTLQLVLLQCKPPPSPVILPPGLVLASFGLPLQVQGIMTMSPPWLLHYTAIKKDALTLPLGNLTRTVMMTLPLAIMGGLPWHAGGLSLAMGGNVSEIVPFGIMGGLLFPPVTSLLTSSHSMMCQLLFGGSTCHGVDGVFSWWYICAAEFFVACNRSFVFGLQSDNVLSLSNSVRGSLWPSGTSSPVSSVCSCTHASCKGSSYSWVFFKRGPYFSWGTPCSGSSVSGGTTWRG
jgi:hypothetical protein